MDLRKLKKLIDLVEESGIAEIEVTEGEEKVRITRTTAAASSYLCCSGTCRSSGAAPAAAPAAAAPAPPLPLAICPTRKNRLWSVRSISAPGPNAAAFVEVGKQVKSRRYFVHHRSHEADERNRSREIRCR